ncbi:hypothetical protein ISCGN_029717 [Ixodes scapularis]
MQQHLQKFARYEVLRVSREVLRDRTPRGLGATGPSMQVSRVSHYTFQLTSRFIVCETISSNVLFLAPMERLGPLPRIPKFVASIFWGMKSEMRKPTRATTLRSFHRRTRREWYSGLLNDTTGN